MIFILDNYDSFTYNLVQYFQTLGQEVIVRRNDQTSIKEIENKKPDYLCISAGPGHPKKADLSIACINHFAGKLPIFGVGLGHQAIAVAYGGHLTACKAPVHGKIASIQHHQKGLFKTLPSPFQATLYHSFVVDEAHLPQELKITARTQQGEIMGLAHKKLTLYGVQFHPESLFTEYGHELLHNFLNTEEVK